MAGTVVVGLHVRGLFAVPRKYVAIGSEPVLTECSAELFSKHIGKQTYMYNTYRVCTPKDVAYDISLINHIM